VIVGLKLSSPPHDGVQSPMANDGINYVHIYSSNKNPKGLALESFQTGEHMEVLGGGIPRDSMDFPCPFPSPWPMNHLHLSVPELFSSIVNQ
jgi:hypothetical protein